MNRPDSKDKMACGCLPGCPDENWLAAYAEGGLTQAERTGVEAHLASCRGCRAGLLFASLGVLEEAPKVAVELEPAQAPRQIRICVVVKDAVARVEQFFEETLELLVAPLGRRVAPEFRGADGVRTSQVRLGPFELSLQRERPAGGGLDIGVTKQHMPLAETWTTFMLSSGQKVEARTDSRGWLHIADIALDQVECIWINVLA